VEFRDLAWHNISWDVVGDLSELIQHEYDHLEGILATMRAVNNRAFALKKST
jgi:peptide deformylase